MSSAAPDTLRLCSVCGGEGVWFDEKVEAGRYGAIKICQHVLEVCRCGGEAPFQYWDESSNRQPCPCSPTRRRLQEISRIFKAADIPSRFRWKFSSSFLTSAPGSASPLVVARNVMPVLEHMSALLNDDREPQRGYLFYGAPGTGKTLLSCIILNELILHRARWGKFLNLSRKYFQQLRDTFSESSDQYGQTFRIIEQLSQLPYLILDDFGVQRGTEWETEVLYDLVDSRYGDQRFTIVTTNGPVDEIRQLAGGRIYSRLVEMCYAVDMAGEDYRMFSKAE